MNDFCLLDINNVSYISRIYTTKFDNSMGNNIPIRWGCDVVVSSVLIEGLVCNENSYNIFIKDWSDYKKEKGIMINGKT